ncbi:MAG: glutamate 5-kinase [Candidatus Omnitrophota bacterium]
MKELEKNYKRIVVKIGSSLLYGEDSGADCFADAMEELSGQISALVKAGKEIIIVSSGAIALGMRILKMKARPRELSSLQAVAAIGQHILMSQYRRFFEEKELTCAQVLLTWDDFNDRKRYLNAKNTLLELFKLRSIPIINENDSVSNEEIKFGDNDNLSALVAGLIKADILIILSDVEGLLDKEKKPIRVVDEINQEVKSLACPTDKKTCVGGMITKIEAAKIAVDSGIPCVIADGRKKEVISALLKEPHKQGTIFLPKKGYLAAREHWIAFGTKPKGEIIVDDGAKNALINKKSLLSVGVINASGNFECGDIVSIVDRQNYEFARGKAAISGRQLDKVKGARSEKEVIHCDNIVIL